MIQAFVLIFTLSMAHAGVEGEYYLSKALEVTVTEPGKGFVESRIADCPLRIEASFAEDANPTLPDLESSGAIWDLQFLGLANRVASFTLTQVAGESLGVSLAIKKDFSIHGPEGELFHCYGISRVSTLDGPSNTNGQEGAFPAEFLRDGPVYVTFPEDFTFFANKANPSCQSATSAEAAFFVNLRITQAQKEVTYPHALGQQRVWYVTDNKPIRLAKSGIRDQQLRFAPLNPFGGSLVQLLLAGKGVPFDHWEAVVGLLRYMSDCYGAVISREIP